MRCEHAVFVYGTLRRGCSNHGLLAGSEYLGPARTVQAYALYVGACPLVVKDQAVSPVLGEVYRVDAAGLARLDELEEHPHVYRRELTEVELDAGERLTAWLYFYPRPEGTPVLSGDYAAWSKAI
jgi:gamma-glutamylcyclotransferase (GGCT)/AIG2-like uncharacterized protein YtfP